MTIEADVYYAIGKSHVVCQDYARVWRHPDGSVFAGVSDGCSGSPDTDVGARLMLCAANKCRDHEYADNHLTTGQTVAWVQQNLAAELGLPPTCTDATLLYIHADPAQNTVQFQVAGDGVVVLVFPSKTAMVYEFTYSNEAPGYLSYLTEMNRLSAYLQTNPVRTTQVYDFADGRLTPAFDALTLQMHTDTPGHFLAEGAHRLSAIEQIFVFTDGVRSFVKETSPGKYEPIPLEDVLTQVLAVPNFHGPFLRRRCKRFRQFCEKNGWAHMDDFSVAAIYVSPDMSKSAT